MKKNLMVLLFILLPMFLAFAGIADVLTQADALYDAEEYVNGFELLEKNLPSATSPAEKGEVLWRMSRFQLFITDDAEDDGVDSDTLLAMFEEGRSYGDRAIELAPSADAYYWRTSNIGRWGETKGILDSLFKAGDMKKDLLEVISYDPVYADAWYVLGRLYFKLPGWPISFGDKAFAVSFARRSIDTYAGDDLKISYYKSLAEILYDRNWSASTREKEIKKRERKIKSSDSEFDQKSYYEAELGVKARPGYMKKALGDISDREEAVLITDWVIAQFNALPAPTKGEKNSLQEVTDMIAQW